jgi:hypothetical protein
MAKCTRRIRPLLSRCVAGSRACLLAAVVATSAIPAHADNAVPQVYGNSIGNWGQIWWQWALNFPEATIPLLQDGAVDCSVGQSGKVWFLAGNFGGVSNRSCTVRNGRALFFPLLNGIAWMPEDCTVANKCRTLVSEALIDGLVELTCVVDGTPCVFTHQIVRAQSDPRKLNFPPGSLAVTEWGYAPGLRPASFADGYWVMLDPLPPGPHTIRFTAKRAGFDLDVTYQLLVGN